MKEVAFVFCIRRALKTLYGLTIYHPALELTCILGGTGTRHVGNHPSTYDKGELILIGPNLPHSGFGLNASYPHEEVVLQVGEEILKKDLMAFPEMKPIADLLERSRYGVAFKSRVKKQVTRHLTELIDASPFKKYMGLLDVMEQLAHSREYDLLNKQIVNSSTIKPGCKRFSPSWSIITMRSWTYKG